MQPEKYGASMHYLMSYMIRLFNKIKQLVRNQSYCEQTILLQHFRFRYVNFLHLFRCVYNADKRPADLTDKVRRRA